MSNKGPVDMDATIKQAFGLIVKMAENKLENTKSSKSVEEYDSLKNDIDYLRGIATNPKGFFKVKKSPNDIYAEFGKFLDLNIMLGHYAPQNLEGTWLLDSLLLYSAKYYNAEDWNNFAREESKDAIFQLNKMFKLINGNLIARIFGTFASAERYAVRKGEKSKSR